jgi:hypothetical protein
VHRHSTQGSMTRRSPSWAASKPRRFRREPATQAPSRCLTPLRAQSGEVGGALHSLCLSIHKCTICRHIRPVAPSGRVSPPATSAEVMPQGIPQEQADQTPEEQQLHPHPLLCLQACLPVLVITLPGRSFAGEVRRRSTGRSRWLRVTIRESVKLQRKYTASLV